MHTVREFVETAFEYADLDPYTFVDVDKRFFQPAEIDLLLADSSKSRQTLGSAPKTSFHELVMMMVYADIIRFKPLPKKTQSVSRVHAGAEALHADRN